MAIEPCTSERNCAEQAYVFGYPMLESYKTMYIQAIDPGSGFFQAPLNQFYHSKQPVTPDFPVVTPNNDTLYSMAWLDLSQGPVLLQVPAVEGRYYSFQLIDMYTFNYAYVGTRATGTGAGSFFIAGPSGAGAPPAGSTALPASEGNFVFLLGRTEWKGSEEDLALVNAIQDQYTLTLPSGYSPPSTADFPPWSSEQAESPGFVEYLNFLFSNVEINDGERSMIESWSSIGIKVAGGPEPSTPDSSEVQAGIDAALTLISDGTGDLGSSSETKWEKTLGIFGSRDEMVARYGDTPKLYEVRAAAAMFGLYGNTDYEAYYPKTSIGFDGEDLDSSEHDYTIHFTPESIPPVESHGFWSITIYKQTTSRFVRNDGEIYSLGNRSPLIVDAAGSFTFYVQKAPKLSDDGTSNHPNWLPAPGCPGDTETQQDGDYRFYLVARLYVPKDEALSDGGYAPPAVVPSATSS